MKIRLLIVVGALAWSPRLVADDAAIKAPPTGPAVDLDLTDAKRQLAAARVRLAALRAERGVITDVKLTSVETDKVPEDPIRADGKVPKEQSPPKRRD